MKKNANHEIINIKDENKGQEHQVENACPALSITPKTSPIKA